MSAFHRAVAAARTVDDLEAVVHAAIGPSELMEFARYDSGDVLRKEHGGKGPKMLRLVVGNPLIMKEMAKAVPDAAPYAPVTILVDERAEGVHLSYDSIASQLAPYGSQGALAVAKALDAKVESLLEAAATTRTLSQTRKDPLMSIKGNALATYAASADPALIDYYPKWVDKLADDATVEGSLLDGAVQGADAVRKIVVTIRLLYERQEHKFAGPYGDNSFLEDYIAQVRGEPIGCVVTVTRNAAGKTQHVAASYRPRSSLLLLSRLVREKLAGTPYAEQFAASES